MKTKILSINDLLDTLNIKDLQELSQIAKRRFQKRFENRLEEEVKVELIFTDYEAMFIAYNELRYNPDYNRQYKVSTDPHASRLYVYGAKTLFDYFGTREPNLLTLSRNNKLKFKVEYLQEYSGIIFNGEVHYGELLGRNCLIELSFALPELALAGIAKIGHNSDELNTLLTRIYLCESEVIVA